MAGNEEVTRAQELVHEMTVGQVMVRDIITISPTALMSDLRDLLRNERIAGVPVVDDDHLIGLVSLEDFIKWLAAGGYDCSVDKTMTRDVKILYDNDPLVHAVEEFKHFDYGRFPVLARETGKIVGIITKGDIIKGLLNEMEIGYQAEESASGQAGPSLKEIIADQARFTFRYDIIGKDLNRAGETSSKLKTALARLGIPPKILRRIAIATYEAEMNTVIYTDGGKLATWVTSDKIVVEVEDTGPGIENIKKAMEPGFSTAPDWVRELGFGAGMGLCNIKKCADQMTLTSTVGVGTNLTFSVVLDQRKDDEISSHS